MNERNYRSSQLLLIYLISMVQFFDVFSTKVMIEYTSKEFNKKFSSSKAVENNLIGDKIKEKINREGHSRILQSNQIPKSNSTVNNKNSYEGTVRPIKNDTDTNEKTIPPTKKKYEIQIQENSTVPIKLPTKLPTESPTMSFVPTGYPTLAPTYNPTTKPSKSFVPSKSPSLEPSFNPSKVPSLSLEPTLSPSLVPSLSPSSLPSISLMPSDSPSLNPSSSPSFYPSRSPSYSPSSKPSVAPSSNPTLSSLPSAIPSYIPSTSPSYSLKLVRIVPFSLFVSYFSDDSPSSNKKGNHQMKKKVTRAIEEHLKTVFQYNSDPKLFFEDLNVNITRTAVDKIHNITTMFRLTVSAYAYFRISSLDEIKDSLEDIQNLVQKSFTSKGLDFFIRDSRDSGLNITSATFMGFVIRDSGESNRWKKGEIIGLAFILTGLLALGFMCFALLIYWKSYYNRENSPTAAKSKGKKNKSSIKPSSMKEKIESRLDQIRNRKIFSFKKFKEDDNRANLPVNLSHGGSESIFPMPTPSVTSNSFNFDGFADEYSLEGCIYGSSESGATRSQFASESNADSNINSSSVGRYTLNGTLSTDEEHHRACGESVLGDEYSIEGYIYSSSEWQNTGMEASERSDNGDKFRQRDVDSQVNASYSNWNSYSADRAIL